MNVASTSPKIAIADIRRDFTGRVIGPGDADYDQARTVLFGGVDRRPAVIVRVADADDVATRDRARARDRPRARGPERRPQRRRPQRDRRRDRPRPARHEGARHRRRRPHRVGRAGPDRRRVLDRASAPHGLAIGFGDTGSVGIGGITLGGGVGYLVRKHGLTIDDLLAAEIVTADGELLRVDADTHPDLFWAIRGGGGNFGVATRFQFRLHEVAAVRRRDARSCRRRRRRSPGFIAAAEAAPEELSTIANVMPCPPMPFVPEEHHGELVIFGDARATPATPRRAERAIAPFRALATPLADMVQPDAATRRSTRPRTPTTTRPRSRRTMFIDRVDRPTSPRRSSSGSRRPTPRCGSPSSASSAARWPASRPTPRRSPTAPAGSWSTSPRSTTAPTTSRRARPGSTDFVGGASTRATRGAYVNFLGDEGEERVRAAYPGATWDRLAAIKAQYDPTNLFRAQPEHPAAPAD